MKFVIGECAFIGPGSEKKWSSMEEKSTRNLGSYLGKDAFGIRLKLMSNFPCNNSIVQGKLKSKGHEELSIHFVADEETIETFWAYISLPISSVFSEQSQTCVKNVNPITVDQGDLIKWWDNQLSLVKSRQKFLWRMTTQHIKTLYCSDMKRGFKVFHRLTEWTNFAWVSFKLGSISRLKTLENNSMEMLVVNTISEEIITVLTRYRPIVLELI